MYGLALENLRGYTKIFDPRVGASSDKSLIDLRADKLVDGLAVRRHTGGGNERVHIGKVEAKARLILSVRIALNRSECGVADLLHVFHRSLIRREHGVQCQAFNRH